MEIIVKEGINKERVIQRRKRKRLKRKRERDKREEYEVPQAFPAERSKGDQVKEYTSIIESYKVIKGVKSIIKSPFLSEFSYQLKIKY